MINFTNTYKLASTLKTGDKYRMIGGSVLIVDSIETVENKLNIKYHTFDMTRDGSKTTGQHSVALTAKVREAN